MGQRSRHCFQSADIADGPVQPPCPRTDNVWRLAQIEAAVDAAVLRNEFGLIEDHDAVVAGRASITKSAAMDRTCDPGRRPPSPPKVRLCVVGKTSIVIATDSQKVLDLTTPNREDNLTCV
ncbi:hypothetical protein K9B32_08875 [Rhizobium sp. 3T7]|uniref:hypothetical protein n=1 Tax=Rhizobium sp. 3T7 TaxID=2874922 RepID=UPI001CCE47C8|nr:hypothetical protein [Rhizobium sp. 3T7]MBZ9790242.1 hypothetical protein [Rhizobium sp. 3T7]